jgi:hypothetical protein
VMYLSAGPKPWRARPGECPENTLALSIPKTHGGNEARLLARKGSDLLTSTARPTVSVGMPRSALKVFFACLLGFAVLASAQSAEPESRGTLDDPNGGDLRAEQRSDAAVVAMLKAGEPFTYQCGTNAEWCQVTLASGKKGWIEQGRIRYYFTEKDLPVQEKKPSRNLSEIDSMARGRGLNYALVTRRAARGDTTALKQFFSLAQDADGAAAETIAGMPTIVYHLLGDAKFAAFLGAQPVAYQMKLRNMILGDGFIPSANLYFRRHFPDTTRLLFRQEITDWFSPDGAYAIRKVFSDEFDLKNSKVIRAELIEKKSGRVLCDLSPDDVGSGADREGEVLWSPDSKRVACLSIDRPEQHGNLFSTPRAALQKKQTAVYQLSGDMFVRVDLPLSEVPGRKEDKELERAVLGHEYTEPMRWQKANVLVLQRHEYYNTPKPIPGSDLESIQAFDRMYEITVTVGADNKATVVWKQRKDR